MASSFLQLYERDEEKGNEAERSIITSTKGLKKKSHHSEAEKQRRDRINAHLANLRSLIPNSHKMDKAGLLGSVIGKVSELQTQQTSSSSSTLSLPSEVDEIAIDYCDTDPYAYGDLRFIKVSICCDDGHRLLTQIAAAFKSLKLRVVRAQMRALGGRIKCIFVVSYNHRQGGGSGNDGDIRTALTRSLTPIATASSSSISKFTSKRQRFFNASPPD